MADINRFLINSQKVWNVPHLQQTVKYKTKGRSLHISKGFCLFN
jgi:hypothetical protein